MLSPSLFLHSEKPLLYWLLPVSLKRTACMNQGWTTLHSYEYPAITLCLDCTGRPELHLQVSFHSSTLFPLCKGAVAETRILAKLVYNRDSGLLMAWEAYSCQFVSHIQWKAIFACSFLASFFNKIKFPVEGMGRGVRGQGKSVQLRLPQPRCLLLKL